jgi:hypothetical protein
MMYDEMSMTCSMHEKIRTGIIFLVAKVRAKRLVEFLRHRWKGSRMDLKGTGHEDLNLTVLFGLLGCWVVGLGPSAGLF